ncbi:MAG TPA: diacylglycerol kinase family protein [Candidatus Moranbacteria bacterium]|nr:diacylglycerol kinase family protein [Candidatus Moranbacteria bacterium]
MLKILSNLRRSFSNALSGLFYAIRSERNLQIELVAAFVVIVLILVLQVEKWEAVVLLLLVFTVIIMEILNTLVERLIDFIKPRVNAQVGVLKDLMAAAVFLAATMAAVVGTVIFWPYVFG